MLGWVSEMPTKMYPGYCLVYFLAIVYTKQTKTMAEGRRADGRIRKGYRLTKSGRIVKVNKTKKTKRSK